MQNKKHYQSMTKGKGKGVFLTGIIILLAGSLIWISLLALLIQNGTMKIQSVPLLVWLGSGIIMLIACTITVKRSKQNKMIYTLIVAAIYLFTQIVCNRLLGYEQIVGLPVALIMGIGIALLSGLIGANRKKPYYK